MGRLSPRWATALAALALLGGCTTGGGQSSAPEQDAPSPLPRATEPPRPQDGACYRLSFAEAVAYTTDAEPRGCRRGHTSVTYAVGELDTVVDGHLVAVDSDRVKDQVAAACPPLLGDHIGGTLAQQRLSMLRAVWFTPTVEASDRGERWYRCDVIAVAGDRRLAPLEGDLRGALSTPEGRDRWGMCGTAAPGARDFERVLCSAPHSWRAVEVVKFASDTYPGEEQAEARGQEQC